MNHPPHTSPDPRASARRTGIESGEQDTRPTAGPHSERRLWREHRWFRPTDDGRSWMPLLVTSPMPACDGWSDPLPIDARLSARGLELLASSSGQPIADRWPDGSLYLFSLDWGALVVRRCTVPVSALGDAAPPEPPTPVIVRVHPFGMAGLRHSAEMIAFAIARDMHDPLIIEWARQTIADAGLKSPRGYQDNDEIIAILFREQKKKVAFVKDPAHTELMATAAQLLCLDPKGYCLRAGDCDDQLIVLGSAASTLGIPVRLLISIYAGGNQGHVTMQYKWLSPEGPQKDQWHCIDPSVESGRCSDLPTIDRFTVEIDTMPGGNLTFIGLGDPPHALEESGMPSTLGDAAPALSAAESQGWLDQLSAAKSSLDAAYGRLSANTAAFQAVRKDLGLPPTDVATASESAFGTGIAGYAHTGVWTQQAADDEARILATGAQLSQAMGEALSGSRPIYFHDADLFIAAQPGDTFRVLLTPNAQGAVVPTYFDADNQPVGTLGFAPILIGAVIAIVSIASAYAVSHIMDYLAAAHHDDALNKISSQQAALVASGAQTPEQSQAQVAALTDLSKAQAPPPPKGLLSDLFSTAPVVTTSLIAIAGVAGGWALSRVLSPHALFGKAAA